MSILQCIFCKEKIRVLPVEIKNNDYMSTLEHNIKRKYGEKFSEYGYVYKNSIAIYQVERFAEQDSQTQMTALLFEVQFFAHTIYPPYNVPIECEIKERKQKKSDYKVTKLFLQPVVKLNDITRKFFGRNPITVKVEVLTTDLNNQDKYQINNIVKIQIYRGELHFVLGQCWYICKGTIQGIKSAVGLQRKFINYEQQYIQKKTKLLKQKNNKREQDQEQNNFEDIYSEDIDLKDIDLDSDQSFKEDNQKGVGHNRCQDQEQRKRKRVTIHALDQDQKSEEKYDTEEEDENEEEEQQEGEEEDENEEEEQQQGEEDDDLNDYEVDEEEEVQDDYLIDYKVDEEEEDLDDGERVGS